MLKQNLKSIKFFILNNKKSRSSIFIYNTVINFILKGGVFLINFLSVPLLIELLKNYKYGIWEIAFTITSFSLILNFGLGNSLRNLITINLTKNKKNKINHLISITFLLSIVLGVVFFFFFALFFFFFDDLLLKLSKEVYQFIIITFITFIINIVLSVYSSISNAFQKSYLISIYNFIQAVIFIVSLIILKNLDYSNNLLLIGITFSLSTVLTNLMLGIHLYSTNKWLRITFPYKNKIKHSKYLINKGKYFAIIQLATLFLFSSDAIFIAMIYDVKNIAEYSIINKLYFYIITIVSLILIQLWNSTANAFAMKEFEWIISIKRRLEYLLFPVFIIVLIIIFFHKEIFMYWIGSNFIVNFNILFLLGIYTLFHIWTAISVNILNGIDALKQQLKVYLYSNILFLIFIFNIYYFKLNIEFFVLSKTIIIIIISVKLHMIYKKEIFKLKKKE